MLPPGQGHNRIGAYTVVIAETETVREFLVRLWNDRCAYCREPLQADPPWHVEHVTPIARGGSGLLSNLAPSCPPCNSRKGTKTAEEYGHPTVSRQARAVARADWSKEVFCGKPRREPLAQLVPQATGQANPRCARCGDARRTKAEVGRDGDPDLHLRPRCNPCRPSPRSPAELGRIAADDEARADPFRVLWESLLDPTASDDHHAQWRVNGRYVTAPKPRPIPDDPPARGTRLNVSLTKGQRDLVERAAMQDEMPAATWARSLLVRAARKQLGL